VLELYVKLLHSREKSNLCEPRGVGIAVTILLCKKSGQSNFSINQYKVITGLCCLNTILLRRKFSIYLISSLRGYDLNKNFNARCQCRFLRYLVKTLLI